MTKQRIDEMQTEIAKVILYMEAQRADKSQGHALRCPAVNTILKQQPKITMYMFTFEIIQEYTQQNTTTHYEHRCLFINKSCLYLY